MTDYSICSSCGKSILAQNFPLHEARCNRFQRKRFLNTEDGPTQEKQSTEIDNIHVNTSNSTPTSASTADNNSVQLNDDVVELGGSGWCCGACTFRNHPTNSSCEICGHVRESIGVPSESNRRDRTSNWSCEMCTFLNSNSSQNCQMCQNVRPPDQQYVDTLIVEPPISNYSMVQNIDPTLPDPEQQSHGWNPNPAPVSNLFAGTALGALGGMGLAMLSGRDIRSGALTGAAVGMVGGSLLSSLSNSFQSRPTGLRSDDLANCAPPATYSPSRNTTVFERANVMGSRGGRVGGYTRIRSGVNDSVLWTSMGMGPPGSADRLDADLAELLMSLRQQHNAHVIPLSMNMGDAMGMSYEQLLSR